MLDYDISEELREELTRLTRKNPTLKIALKNKMREIICRDETTIEFYKNLEAPLNEYKRVHVGSFVLTFKYDREKKFIFFHSFRHHDEAYGK